MSFLQQEYELNSNAPERSKMYSFDANQQARSLSAWEQRYSQHSNGRFSGFLDELKLPGLHLFEEFTSQSLIQQCCVGQDSWWIGVSSCRNGAAINGARATERTLMVRPSDVEFELYTPENFHIFGIVIDRGFFPPEMPGWGETAVLLENTNPRALSDMAGLIQMLLCTREGIGKRLVAQGVPNRHLIALIRSAVTDRLLSFSACAEQGDSGYQSRLTVLRRIRLYMEQSGEFPCTLEELCRIACTSPRTLQYSFERELGSTPVRFIRDCRLNQIRRHLLEEGTSAETPIAELAIRYGFFHAGTFNLYYKQLFGETPSQTRERAGEYGKAAKVALRLS